jgi:GDP-4-dehydro-6-deoxy-D-mannose reductase
MNILITGASGFTGLNMIEFLNSHDEVRITGLARKNQMQFSSTSNISWTRGDILARDSLYDIVSSVNPDVILHLAGLSSGSLAELRETNVTGTRNILDAAIRVNPSCRILVISSSAVYGYAGNTPIAETHTLNPLSVYGVSKVEQETMCREYTKTGESQIAIARPFNLLGPNQPASFVCGRIVQQVIEIERGERNSLDLFEIQSTRDFIDVRDVVNAYWALLSHPDFSTTFAGEVFNIGSGNATAISDVIELIERITGENYPVQLPVVPVTVPVPCQQCDYSLIHTITGWTPTISLSDSLCDMLDAARKRASCS